MKTKRKWAAKAMETVKAHATAEGMAPDTFINIPLHYHMADLVTGLMLLAKQEGLEWDQIVSDAKEFVNDPAQFKA